MAKREIVITTPDGKAKARLFKPDGPAATAQTGVIVYMDAFGPRPALDTVGERLAEAGYVALVPDLFYRFGAYGPLDAKTGFSAPDSRARIMGMLRATTQAQTERDSGSFLDTLTSEGVTDRIGVVGYCMGGARALTAAAAYPERIAAAASIHGGNLASDAWDSPHRRAASIAARVYVATAGIDKSFLPEQSARLAEALREAGVDHMIENYVGMAHGWAMPDHSVFDAAGAERHWKRLLTFFEETLK